MGKGGSAHAVLDLIGKLYGVEHQAKKQKLDPEQTKALRAEKSRPILDKLKALLDVRAAQEPARQGYRLCPARGSPAAAHRSSEPDHPCLSLSPFLLALTRSGLLSAYGAPLPLGPSRITFSRRSTKASAPSSRRCWRGAPTAKSKS